MQFHRLVACAALAAALFTFGACSPEGIPFGPVPVTLSIEGGTLDPEPFARLAASEAATISVRVPYCGLPTEQDIIDQVPEMGPVNLSGFVSLDVLEVVAATLFAEGGDFSAIREIVISFVPKPSLGAPWGPIEIGRATSPTGFGNAIELIPNPEVNFLDLIRDNDDNPFPGCPQLEITVTSAVQSQPITLSGEATVNVYGHFRP